MNTWKVVMTLSMVMLNIQAQEQNSSNRYTLIREYDMPLLNVSSSLAYTETVDGVTTRDVTTSFNLTEPCSWATESGAFGTPATICGANATRVSVSAYYSYTNICAAQASDYGRVNFETLSCPNGTPIRLVKASSGLQCTGVDISSGMFYYLGTVHTALFGNTGWFRTYKKEMTGICKTSAPCPITQPGGDYLETYRQCYSATFSGGNQCLTVFGKYQDQYNYNSTFALGPSKTECTSGHEEYCFRVSASTLDGFGCCSGRGKYDPATSKCTCDAGWKTDANSNNCATEILESSDALQLLDLTPLMSVMISSLLAVIFI